jgi:hypothetical protein
LGDGVDAALDDNGEDKDVDIATPDVKATFLTDWKKSCLESLSLDQLCMHAALKIQLTAKRDAGKDRDDLLMVLLFMVLLVKKIMSSGIIVTVISS